ncbi:uncharacterized protein TNCV_4856211 [Trichonephila clavipes]|nr:uncharacterized protein TNCV_4856211 [Trichonephila clavipes]
MQKAASELLVLHPTKNKIVECGISVDGTWQRRGYSSMNGCVSALSVDTGKVVDIEIMSSYCPTCRKISKMPRSIESKTFAADHVCHSNFQGSALKMETVGSTRIFQCSIVKRGLKYAHYYGDGDSKGFISVKDTYGKDSVTKYMNALVMFKRECTDTLKLVKRFEETGKLEDRARAGRLCLKEARAACIAVEMEAIASEAASGTSSARETARRLAYHHHLSAIFFVKSSSCTHINCNRAMNFCQQIPHRGKHLRSGPSLKWNRIPHGFLTSCGQMELLSRFMVTLTTITVVFGRPLIHVSTHRSHCIPQK